MANNKLQLNREKTQMMVITRKPATRKEIKIQAHPTNIKHSNNIKILGVDIEQSLSWKFFLMDGKRSVLKQLTTRLNSLKILKKSATVKQMRMFANGILMSKIEYGAEVWAAAPAYILKKLASIQLEAARTVLGYQTKRWSATHLLKEMKWVSVQQLATLASAKLSHKILTTSQPAVLSYRILSKINHTRTTRNNGPFLLGPKPSSVGNSITSKYQFRANSYKNYDSLPQVLRKITKPVIFKKRVKRYLKNNNDLPTNEPNPIGTQIPTNGNDVTNNVTNTNQNSQNPGLPST